MGVRLCHSPWSDVAILAQAGVMAVLQNLLARWVPSCDFDVS
jgi:hypothetical protein